MHFSVKHKVGFILLSISTKNSSSLRQGDVGSGQWKCHLISAGTKARDDKSSHEPNVARHGVERDEFLPHRASTLS